MQSWHLLLSLHNEQTFDELTMDGNNLTMRSTAAGIGLFIAHDKRLTEIDAMSENCGEVRHEVA